MIWPFLRYFLGVIAGSRSRQGAIILAMSGMFLSSFSLLSLQSTMGGLQHKLMGRSKAVTGDALIELGGLRDDQMKEMVAFFFRKGINAVPEFELELLARHGRYLMPVVLHGIPPSLPSKIYPEFLQGMDWKKLAIPSDLLVRLGANSGDDIQLFSPLHADTSFDDIPRKVSESVGQVLMTDVPEIDLAHIWTRLSLAQNIAKSKTFNRLRLYLIKSSSSSSLNFNEWKELENQFRTRFNNSTFRLLTWEEQNSALVWALKLESAVMLFLFGAMSILVSLCISSGLMVFFDKAKIDFTSFWILGASPLKLNQALRVLLAFIALVPIFLGLIASVLFLFILDRYGIEIMPAFFIDRKIPVLITWEGVLTSFFIPALICWILSWWALSNFKQESKLSDYLRAH